MTVRMFSGVVLTAVAQTGIAGYLILYVGVAASWIGIPIIGGGALAAAVPQ